MVWRLGVAATLLAVAAPLAAQDNSTTPAPSPAPAENIGPRELSNFSLNGTVTRSAEPAATVPPPAVREPNSRPGAIVAERPAPARPAESQRRTGPAGSSAMDPLASRPTLRPPSNQRPSAAAAAPGLTNALAPSTPIAAPTGFSPLPWLAALLLIGAGAVIYFGRQQRRQAHAGTAVSEFVAADAPRPTPPPPAARAPAPARPAGVVTSGLRSGPKAPPGVVTSALRPWIELELEPSQAMVTDEQAAIAFDVTLFNSGSAPARDVAIEACLINAGQQQDAELSQFYTASGEARDKIPAVAPLARITLKSAVRLPRSAVQEYEVEGRKLFMPMVAVNSRYRWSSGEGQSAASFLVGRGADDGDRLAPLRLDQGARGWNGLAARRYEKGIRR